MSSLFSAYRPPQWSLHRRLAVTLLVCLAVLVAVLVWKLTGTGSFPGCTPTEVHPDGSFTFECY